MGGCSSRSRSCSAKPRRSASAMPGVASPASRRFDDQLRSRGCRPDTDSITRWLSPPMVKRSARGRASRTAACCPIAATTRRTPGGRCADGGGARRDAEGRSQRRRERSLRCVTVGIECRTERVLAHRLDGEHTIGQPRVSRCGGERRVTTGRSSRKCSHPSASSPKRAQQSRHARVRSRTGPSRAATSGADRRAPRAGDRARARAPTGSSRAVGSPAR